VFCIYQLYLLPSSRSDSYLTNPEIITNTNKAYDYATEFDYRQFNYEVAEISMIGLTPHSVSANATFKTSKELYFPLLSDPKSNLISAMNFKISKGSKNVGVFVIDKEQILQIHSFGKKDSVLDQLDRGMDALMESPEDS
jgi:peroxiredoxin